MYYYITYSTFFSVKITQIFITANKSLTLEKCFKKNIFSASFLQNWDIHSHDYYLYKILHDLEALTVHCITPTPSLV